MEKIIKNYDALATTPLRKDALDILEAGYEAIVTPMIVRKEVIREGNHLRIKDFEADLDEYNRIFFVGIGKCAVDAGLIIEEILGDKITDGMVIDVKEGPFKKIKSRVGTHPYPSEQNVTVSKEIIDMLKNLTDKDLVLMVISGGGSSLFSYPHLISADTLTLITRTMMDKGAPIHDLNIVRKHLSEVQGGSFAKMLYPAKVVSLLFSDVPGDDIGTIASGPTVQDDSTKEQAEAFFIKYDILKKCHLVTLDAIETPKEEKYFEKVTNILLVSNSEGLSAMKEKAEELGYAASIEDDKIQGEAREVGKKVATLSLVSKTCALFGGETTVTVTGRNGTGGRNQEVALGALLYVPEDTVVVAAGSDGWDNSDVAGAIVDKNMSTHAQTISLSAEKFLAENDSYTFFKSTGGHIVTGKTGANVADFYFVLKN